MAFPIDTNLIIFIVLIIAILILTWMLIRLENKLKKFLVSTGAEKIGDSITTMNTSLVNLETFKTELESYLLTVEKRLKKSVQAVHTVRFNPFKGTGSGGNQSFATAFLNQDGTGVVVSTLYAREHISIFSKPIKNGTSEFELSDEEKQAVAEAKKSLSN